MAIAETARLIASLELKDLFTKSVDNATKSMGKLDKSITDTQGRAYKAGQQIGVGIKRGVILATAAVTGLAGLFVVMAKEGQHAADVQKLFENAVRRSGKVSAAYVQILQTQATALSNLTGLDDESIKAQQTRLVNIGLTGQQIQRILPLILDAAKATGRDLDSVTLAVGRATQGAATSLGRLGIIVPKATKGVKLGYEDVLKVLQRFQGANQAVSGSFEVRLSALKERLQDVREEAGIKLLPALVRITDVVAKNLVPAFGQFVQSILPVAITGLNKIADALESGAAAKAFASLFDTIKVAAPILQQTAQATFNIVKAAVELFTSLPAGIQTLAVSAFAINKLTGGLVTNIGGGIADAIGGKLGLTRGSSPANPLFVSDIAKGIGTPINGPGGGNGLPTLLLKALPFLAFGGAAAAQGINNVETTGRLNPLANAAEDRLIAAIHQNTAAVSGNGLANPILDRGGREQGTPGIAGLITKNIRNVLDAVRATFKTGFERMVQALHEARGTKAITAALKEANRLVIQGHKGSAANTAKTISGLKAALSHTDDPKLRSEIKASLAKVQSLLPGRQFAARQIQKADALLRDGKVTTAETKRLKTIMQQLKDRGLPHAAAVIGGKVEAAKKAQVTATNAVGQKIHDQKFSVNVSAQVSLRAIINGQRVVSTLGGNKTIS